MKSINSVYLIIQWYNYAFSHVSDDLRRTPKTALSNRRGSIESRLRTTALHCCWNERWQILFIFVRRSIPRKRWTAGKLCEWARTSGYSPWVCPSRNTEDIRLILLCAPVFKREISTTSHSVYELLFGQIFIETSINLQSIPYTASFA